MSDLKSILKRELGQGDETIDVLVALAHSRADDALLGELRKLGLEIREVVGNKVIGRIAADGLSALEASASVAEVERSVRLKPKGG